MNAEEQEAEAQRLWELEMEQAMQDRGRTRSRSILGDTSATESAATEQSDDAVQRNRMMSMDVVDGGHDPNWQQSRLSNGSSGSVDRNSRLRTRSFSAQKLQALENTDQEFDYGSRRSSGGRRRSCSFSSVSDLARFNAAREQQQQEAEAATQEENDDPETIARRAASLSKMYLVGSAPVDVSKLQDDSKIVGVKKVEVVQPTGALSAKALDALSAGLQLSLDNAVAKEKNEEELTEEQLEEKKMEEEEDQKLKVEKLSTRKTLSMRASLFKSKVFKNSRSMSSRTLSPPSGTSLGSATVAIPAPVASTAEKLRTENAIPNALPLVPKKRHKLKLLLLGDSGVGKTSLMRVFSGDEFSESMLATAGVDFKLRHISVADEDIALQIWDTAGQERFHRITATYYKGANGIVLVYDVSDKKGFDNVGYWMNNIRQFSTPTMMPAMLLVGNKIDLPNRVISSEEGQAAANQYNCRFIETSAKTSENTNGALETIARDAFIMSLNPSMTQKMLLEKEKSFVGRRTKENCVVQYAPPTVLYPSPLIRSSWARESISSMTHRRSCCLARPRTPIQLVPRFLHYVRAGSRARVGAMLAQSRRLANARSEIPPYESVLMLATISAADVAMVDLLLDHGASLDILDARGRDVFLYACQYGASAAMLARLVSWCQQRGRICSSWERMDCVGNRALILACRSLSMELIEYLMDGMTSQHCSLIALEALQTVIETGEESNVLQVLEHRVVQASVMSIDQGNLQPLDERTALLTRCVYTAIQMDMGAVVASMDKLNPFTVEPIVWLFVNQQVPEHASRHFSPLIRTVERRFKRELLWASVKTLFLVRHRAGLTNEADDSILSALVVLPKPLFDKIVRFYPVELDCQALTAQLLAGRCCLESVVSAENCWCALMRST